MAPMRPPLLLDPEHQLQFRKLQYDQEFQLINLLQKHYEDQMAMLNSLLSPPTYQDSSHGSNGSH